MTTNPHWGRTHGWRGVTLVILGTLALGSASCGWPAAGSPPRPAPLPTSPAAALTPGITARPSSGSGNVAPRGATATPAGAPLAPAAQSYLQHALDLMQAHAVVRTQVDWAAIRQEAFLVAAGAQTPAATYDAIRIALSRLGDHHSTLLEPAEAQTRLGGPGDQVGLAVRYTDHTITAVQPGSRAAQAGLRVGDHIDNLDGQPAGALAATAFFQALYAGTQAALRVQRPGAPAPITVPLTHLPVAPTDIPQGRRLPGAIGYLMVPTDAALPLGDQYAAVMQQLIAASDQPPACGWVVDLQNNPGGGLPQMILGVGPILGDGEAGAFVEPDGQREPWSYQGGVYEVANSRQQVASPYHLQRSTPPVAVLTSGRTASAGEAVLISFRGRPGVRSFGAPTAGVPTANSVYDLADGAVLVLTTGLEADRTGQVYGVTEQIAPDQAVASDLRALGTDSDPVLQAARAWLQQQPACRAASR